MKREDEIRIRKFKLVRPRETDLGGRRKWIFDLDSKKILMMFAFMMIVVGLLFVGYQFIQVIEKGRSLAGMAVTSTSLMINTQTASPNYGTRPSGVTPSYIVLHHTGTDSDQVSRNTLTDPNNGNNPVSSHYLVQTDGTVLRLVDEQYRAWHAGEGGAEAVANYKVDMNSNSIGIEVVASSDSAVNAAQYASLNALVTDIQSRDNIPDSNIISHEDWSGSRKGGDGVLIKQNLLSIKGGSSGPPPTITPLPAPAPTPTPTPAPQPTPSNTEQEKSIKEIQDKLKALGFTDLSVDAKSIEVYKKSLEKAEYTPYRTGDLGGKVISIDGKYYTLSSDGTTTLVGKDDSQTNLYDTRPLGEGLTVNQDIKVVNGEKTGEANTYLSQTTDKENPISLKLRQDQFDALSKIDPTKEKVTITPSPAGTTVTVSRGSSEISSFTNSNDLKLDSAGAIQSGTITTTNYNYYEKYFDKGGNQITKAEWDKLKPEDRLTPKDNKNTFRSGLTKEENKVGNLYGEGKEEFLTVDKDGTQYRGELSSRVYNQKTSVDGVSYNQGDGINYVTDGKGNTMTFNCKFYTGCKFDSATDIKGNKVTDVESISDPEFKKFAQKQMKENSQANKRMFFSEITRSMTQFSGVAGYSSLFMDSETLQAWRESVDSAFASMYLGTEYWASKICASKIETSSDNLAYVETPDGLIGVAAHIEGEKIDIQDPVNHTQRYIYKIDYFVQNHESSVVSSGFRKNDKKMKFNVEVRGPGGNKEIYDADIELATGEVKKISKDQMIVKESPNHYDKVCIIFKTPIKTIGSSFATESKDEICNKFSKYTGGPTEVETVSEAGGSNGNGELTSDW